MSEITIGTKVFEAKEDNNNSVIDTDIEISNKELIAFIEAQTIFGCLETVLKILRRFTIKHPNFKKSTDMLVGAFGAGLNQTADSLRSLYVDKLTQSELNIDEVVSAGYMPAIDANTNKIILIKESA